LQDVWLYMAIYVKIYILQHMAQSAIIKSVSDI